MTPKPLAPRLRRSVLALIVVSAALVALAVFQWVELVIVRSGGHSVCGISDTINCETVWNSPFASSLHQHLGMPVAGLGLVFALTALTLSCLLYRRVVRDQPFQKKLLAVRLTAAAGSVATAVFILASFHVGALCLTCLGTYVLVFAFTGLAVFGVPFPLAEGRAQGLGAVRWAGGLAVLFYLLLLGPGLKTPHALTAAQALEGAKSDPGAQSLTTPEGRSRALVDFLAGLSSQQQTQLSQLLQEYRTAGVPSEAANFTSHAVHGAPDAAMRVVEITDILCPHCKHLSEALHELRAKLPEGLFSTESRYFPLDGECNSLMGSSTRADGIRCAGAKAQVCLEGTPEFLRIQEELFARQMELTVEKMEEIASSGSLARPVLDACISRSETAARIQEDINFSQVYKLEGTPLVIINGKRGAPMPEFLYAMALAGANPEHEAFKALPPPTGMLGP